MNDHEKEHVPSSVELYPTPPQGLTWEEIENGTPGQLNLPGMTQLPTVAERAFVILADRWIELYAEEARTGTRTARSDDHLLACLLLACEHGKSFTRVAQGRLKTCKSNLFREDGSLWMDLLPWEICWDSCHLRSPSDGPGIDRLVANLGHHASKVRRWMIDVAWISRVQLPVDRTLPILLENVARSNFYDTMCMALALQITGSKEAFFIAAEKYIPEPRFESQYQAAMARAKEEANFKFTPLLHRETQCYKLISEACLRLIAKKPGCEHLY